MKTCVGASVREFAMECGARAESRSPRIRPWTPARTSGFTLIELLVVLAILGTMAAVAGLAARSLDDTDPAARRAARIAQARTRALETRRPVVIQAAEGDSAGRMLALPDGSVRADTVLRLDPLTGRPRALR